MYSVEVRMDSTVGKRLKKWMPAQMVFMVVLALASAVPDLRAGGKGNEFPFSRSKMIIEFNSTDNDVGAQVLLDGEPWKQVKIESPDGRKLLNIRTSSSLRKQGITELFFESSEPSLDDVPLAEFLARFPEGIYEFEGTTIDGIELEGQAVFTHVIPAGPEIIAPAEGAVVDPDNFVIAWVPVTQTIMGSSDITIRGYQLVVEQEDPLRVHSMDLPATVTSVRIPPEFFLLKNTVHKFEVLAIEEGGNQTITSGSFVTMP